MATLVTRRYDEMMAPMANLPHHQPAEPAGSSARAAGGDGPATRVVGVKSYGYDWANVHGLSMAGAADRLVGHGIDWVLVQNDLDPLPGSAVDQRPPAAGYDDLAFRGLLRERGRTIFESTAVFFAPDAFAADPALRPVGSDGRVFTPSGWYVGICPSDPAYLARKAERIAEVVDRFEPDGVFVSFVRFPGFWELWMPETSRAEIVEYCFCDRCLDRFQAETGIELPAGSVADRARVLTGELRHEWTAWKCALIAGAVRALRAAATAVRPGVRVLLNGFGLGGADYGNAVEEVLGQRFADLDPVVDHYELMFYFQIQRRDPAAWIPSRIAEARGRTGRTVLACLQGGPEYLEPEYAAGRRSRQITDAEWAGALRATAASGADGVLVYSWRDLLADEARGGARVRALRDYRSGVLA
jgi:hypothetical protein